MRTERQGSTHIASPGSAGTMLFGEGTSSEEAHHLLSAAEDCGINFFDSAEMYPVPQCGATQGASERILGAWLRRRRRCCSLIWTGVWLWGARALLAAFARV